MHSTYLDFDLEIGIGQGREYPVAVLRSPAGEARAIMRLPFDELQLESRLKDLQIALLRSGGTRRRAPSQEEQAVIQFGGSLFDALLAGEVRSLYDVSLSQAQRSGQGLRLKLRIASPYLAALPWEFLYDARQAEFVCLSLHTPIVRYIELPRPPQPLGLTPPLRILGLIASPSDAVSLDVDRERQRVEQALAGLIGAGIVELEWLAGQTWRDLQRAMRRGPWHIFHFVGHGEFDANADEGLILLCDDQGKARRFRASELGRMLADHRTLRLAVLNACEGARGSDRDIFSSTASILVQRGMPAVLAMQYEITDRAAIELSRAFYEALAEGLPVDAAVAEARKAVSWAVANTVEWGTPVLYMRASDGVLFELGAAPSPVKPAPKEQEAPPLLRPEPTAAPATTSRPAPAPPAGIQVFISYAREDEAKAQQLYQRLMDVGLRPWMDKADLLPGEQWRESILRAVRQSQFFLACVSTHAVDKRGFLQRELKLAADTWQEKLADDIYLIPVRFDDCEMPEALRTFQWVNLYEPDGWTKLLRGLRAGIERQGLRAPDRLLAELAAPTAPSMAKRGSPAPARVATGDVLAITTPVRMELVRVPAGEFLMGSDPAKDKGAFGDEKPQHSVRLNEFYIGKYPVTNAHYRVFVEATKRKAPSHWQNGALPGGQEDHPVVNVAWDDAVAFCRWLAEATGRPFRLPSEAEWEKAASWDEKARQKRIWPWGDAFDAAKCNTSEGKKGGTTPVGAYSPAGDSPCDAADMAGNVWEWTSSLSKGYPYDPKDGREDPNDRGIRVLRGGSFSSDAWRACCASRAHSFPNLWSGNSGFRVGVSAGL